MNKEIQKLIKDMQGIHDWDMQKKRKYFWTFTILWTLLVFLLGLDRYINIQLLM